MIGSRSAKPRLSLSATSAILCAPNAGSHEIKVDKMVPVMVAVLLGELEVSVFVMVSEEVKLIGRVPKLEAISTYTLKISTQLI
ncbi:hypothetical protein ACLB2K_049094 [Fragaria x ananassa]